MVAWRLWFRSALVVAACAAGLLDPNGRWPTAVADEGQYYPDGNGLIPLVDPFDYPRMARLDNDDPSSIAYTYRPNLLNIEVTPEWDFYNLINTDRPDFTDATYSVGRGVTIIENGYTYRKVAADGLKVNSRRLPESLLRYGVSDEFELRLRWNGYIVSDVHDANTGLSGDRFGTDDMVVGFKYEVWQQEQWRPMLTAVVSTTLPTGTRDLSANQLQPTINLVYGWGIRRWLYLKMSSDVDLVRGVSPNSVVPSVDGPGTTINLSVDQAAIWHQSTSLLFQVSPRVGGFVEWFCDYSSNAADTKPAHYGDVGTYIYLTPHVQLDARIGQRFSNTVEHFFTGAGLSLRF